MKAPRRPELPAKQRSSPGSGPAGPENFGYFPSLESSPPAGGTSPKRRNRGFAASAASFFLSDQKETKESPGDVAFGKDLRLAPWSFMSHFPPDPRFYGGARGMRKQLRPARKPHERYLCLLTAVLLNELDRLLLQDAMRLSGAAYTVGGNRRPGEGTGPYRTGGKPYGRAATWGRPYEIPYPFRGASSWGIPNQEAAAGRPQTMTQRSGHGLERRSKGMERRIPVRVFGAEWTLRRRGLQAKYPPNGPELVPVGRWADLPCQGEMPRRGRGGRGHRPLRKCGETDKGEKIGHAIG